jgi:hypothetical protein
VVVAEFVAVEKTAEPDAVAEAAPVPQPFEDDEDFNISGLESSGFSAIPRRRPPGITPWSTTKGPRTLDPELEPFELATPTPAPEPETPKLKLGIKAATPQSELSLDSTPRGRFEGESPNVFEGEDLDLPPFLRKKK